MRSRVSFSQIADWLTLRDRVAMAVVAMLSFALVVVDQGWLPAVTVALLAASVVAIMVIDHRQFLIPDRLSLPLIPLGLIHPGPLLLPRLVAMAVLWAGLTLLQQAFLRLRGKAGLGGGDVKLMVAAAAWLAADRLAFYVLAAALTALAQALIQRTNRVQRLAFGTHLAPWLLAFVLAGADGATGSFDLSWPY